MVGQEKTNLVGREQSRCRKRDRGIGCGSVDGEQQETDSLHGRTVEREDEKRCAEGIKEKETQTSAGPGPSQIYLLTDGKCGELECRQAERQQNKNNQKWKIEKEYKAKGQVEEKKNCPKSRSIRCQTTELLC